jgi:methionine synthase I (cobalamin-dependent)
MFKPRKLISTHPNANQPKKYGSIYFHNNNTTIQHYTLYAKTLLAQLV